MQEMEKAYTTPKYKFGHLKHEADMLKQMLHNSRT
jgi:hypothetical protein